eukprot:7051829-Lingulodinium_polyedra.AAC.1
MARLHACLRPAQNDFEPPPRPPPDAGKRRPSTTPRSPTAQARRQPESWPRRAPRLRRPPA